MTDVPIIFSAAMILALLAKRKTQTRRLAWRWPKSFGDSRPIVGTEKTHGDPTPWQRVKPGDRLWVRESLCKRQGNFLGIKQDVFEPHYTADDAEVLNEHEFNYVWVWKGKSLPSIHMPRWASRLTLVVTETKIERLQAISDQDAMAEGAKYFPDIRPDPQSRDNRWSMESPSSTDHCLSTPYWAFANFWNKLHGDRAWEVNPEVVAMSLVVHRQNIDAMKEAA